MLSTQQSLLPFAAPTMENYIGAAAVTSETISCLYSCVVTPSYYYIIYIRAFPSVYYFIIIFYLYIMHILYDAEKNKNNIFYYNFYKKVTWFNLFFSFTKYIFNNIYIFNFNYRMLILSIRNVYYYLHKHTIHHILMCIVYLKRKRRWMEGDIIIFMHTYIIDLNKRRFLIKICKEKIHLT
jgi:hypothetical protein